MKLKSLLIVLASVVGFVVNTNAAALGTAFTYQGRLSDGGNPAHGTYDFRFRLASDPLGNNYVGSAVLSNGVPVSDGLFTASLDFGAGSFNGSNYWLEVDVRTNGGGGYSALAPLQPLTPAPGALYAALAGNANTAATADTVAWSSITGIPPGFADGVDNDTQYSAGAGLTLNGTQFNVRFAGNGAAATAAHSDHQHAAADVVSGTLADARLSVNIPRLDGNQTLTGTNIFTGTAILTNGPNRFAGTFAGDGGGLTNLNGSVLADGSITTAKIASGAVTGGQLAVGAVGTGQLSDSAVTSAKIADGTIVAADVNAPSFSTTFWKVDGNTGTSPTNGNFIGTTDNQPLELRVNGTRAMRLEPATNASRGFSPNVIGGYQGNSIATCVIGATISGGGRFDLSEGDALSHHITAHHGTIGGGDRNTVAGEDGTVAGGGGNVEGGPYSSIGGGLGNTVITNAWYVTIGGGAFNSVGTNSSSCTISGGYSHTIRENTLDGTIGGGSYHVIGTNSYYSTIGGGRNNSIGDNAISAAIGGGYFNSIRGQFATIPGGYFNQAVGNYSFAAGEQALASHDGTFVWSDASSFTAFASTTTNQFNVRATGGVRFVTAGAGMTLDGQSVATADALTNVALRTGGNDFTGQQVITGGDANQLILQNSADSRSWYIYDENFNGSGALIFQPSSPGVGAYIRRSDGVYVVNSDERLKRDIAAISGVLDRVLQLRPVSYHFRSAPEGSPLSLGFIAQEVEPLFPEVVTEHAGMKGLAYSELVPVAIRAVQELNQKMDSENRKLREELKRRDAEDADLKLRLDALERIIQSQESN